MFFSKVECYRNPGILSVYDPYEIHRFVWRLFERDPNAKRDFLYRCDLQRGKPSFYLLSLRTPLPEGEFWRTQTKPFEPKLNRGDRMSFSLRANPVVTQNGKRNDVVMARKKELGPAWRDSHTPEELRWDCCKDWLKKRSEMHGFAFSEEALRIESLHQNEFWRGNRKRTKGEEVKITRVDFQGLLEVTEPDAFRAMLFNGIGPAKAFGCGLMLVRRL